MRTLIAIPCMDYMEANFVECLLSMRPVGEVEYVLLKSTLVYDARNQLAQKAIAEGYDYVLWLDSDMTFEPDLMERMFASIGDKPMLTALCFGRRPPFRPCIFRTLDVKKDGLGFNPISDNWYNYPRNEIVEVAGCGFAVVLQKVDMLKDVMELFPVAFFPIGGLGEDLAFCYRAAQLGYKFYADTSIKPGHIMRMSVDESFREQVFADASLLD